ncbi:hypothetical protein Bbelb_055530 [Branchiostoma belcheri]|nr:hypothetical protein Bbelb_055530 [Branchiostoma belcheri]
MAHGRDRVDQLRWAKMRVFTPDGYYADSHYSAAMSTLAYSWSEWTPWSACTVSCDAGNQTRYRTCNTAAGNGSVANCTGDALQTRACMDIGPCPGPQEPHSASTAGPTVAQTTPSLDPLAPSDGGTMEEFARWETGEALPDTYDAQESPVDMAKGEPLPTSSGVMLESIGWLSDKTMDFNITATFTVAWTDTRLANLGGTGWIPVPSHVLWLPSVQFGRTVKARWSVTTSSEMSDGRKGEETGPESGTVSTWLSPEGQISHRLKKKLRVSCLMDLRNYPFDSQTCNIQLHGYGGIAFQVFATEGARPPLVLDLTDMDSQFIVAKTELLAIAGSFRREGRGCSYFHQTCDLGPEADSCPALRFCDVSEPECKKCSMYSGVCQVLPTNCNGSQADSPADTFSTLEARLHFRRRLPYYILRVYTPTATVVAVSWMSFWVHYTETSARVALGCTTFLMLVRLSSQIEKMPHISYIRAIDLWYMFCLAFAFMVILEYAVVHHLHNPQNKKVKQNEREETQVRADIPASREENSTVVSLRKRFARAVNEVRVRQVLGRNRVRPSLDSTQPVPVQSSEWDLIVPTTSKHTSETSQLQDERQEGDNKDSREAQSIVIPSSKRFTKTVNQVRSTVKENNCKSASQASKWGLVIPPTSRLTNTSKTSHTEEDNGKSTQEDQPIVISPSKRFTKAANQVRPTGTVKKSRSKSVGAQPTGWGLLIPPSRLINTPKTSQQEEDNGKSTQDQSIVVPSSKRFVKAANQVRSTVEKANSREVRTRVSAWGLVIPPTSSLTAKISPRQEGSDQSTKEEQMTAILPSKSFRRTSMPTVKISQYQEGNHDQISADEQSEILPSKLFTKTSIFTVKTAQYQEDNDQSTKEDQMTEILQSKRFRRASMPTVQVKTSRFQGGNHDQITEEDQMTKIVPSKSFRRTSMPTANVSPRQEDNHDQITEYEQSEILQSKRFRRTSMPTAKVSPRHEDSDQSTKEDQCWRFFQAKASERQACPR